MAYKNKFHFKPVALTALVTTCLAFLGNLTIYFITNNKPYLQYEILPVSTFRAGNIQTSIATIKIVNSGDKECEDVALDIKFGSGIIPENYSIQKSSEPITIKQKYDSTVGRPLYSIPYLNPKEQIVFSFLLNNLIDEKHIEVDLRSKGLTGEKLQGVEIPMALIIGTIGMFTMAITLISVVVFHQRRVISLNKELMKFADDTIASLRKELPKS